MALAALQTNPPPGPDRFPTLRAAPSDVALRPPGEESETEDEVPDFEGASLPVFNNNTNNGVAKMLASTMCFLWCVGNYCEETIENQLEILQEAVRYIGKTCPTAEIQLHTFSRNRSSLLYQDNPVFVVM
jgi:hypothetical protein